MIEDNNTQTIIQNDSIQSSDDSYANNIQDLFPASDYSASRGAVLVVAICFIIGFVSCFLASAFAWDSILALVV